MYFLFYFAHFFNRFFYVIGIVIGGVLILFIMCFVFIILHIKSKQRGLQTIPENSNNEIRSGYPGTQPVNYNAQPNTRSAFVVADNSAYNYDINKICKRYLILTSC